MKQASNILTLLCVGSLIALAATRWESFVPDDPSSSLAEIDGQSGPDASAGQARARISGATIAAAGVLAPRPVIRPEFSSTPLICDDARLVGRRLDALSDADDERCGLKNPVEVTSVAGVEVSPPIATGCKLATALADWLERDIADHAGTMLDAQVTRIDQVSGYVCRNRNSAAKGRLSEHAVANAIDVASFHLDDGRRIAVETGWPAKDETSDFLKAAWMSACQRFGTVLGPDADEWHRDHFHLDGIERRAAYCR